MNVAAHYVAEARRIRAAYKELVGKVDINISKMQDFKDQLNSVRTELESIEANTLSDNVLADKMASAVIRLEQAFERVNSEHTPHVEGMQALEHAAKTLYGQLRERYPDASDQALHAALFE